MKHKGLTVSAVLLGVALAISVWGDPTALSISNGTATVTSSSPTTLNFQITRAGDTSYDAFVQFQTQDGTAIAGTDYTAATGSIVIPAGTSSAAIPVTVAGSNSNHPDRSFQMRLLGGGGAPRGFTPSFALAQTFATGDTPIAVTTADINGDGKRDLIMANLSDTFGNTVSVLLNTTAPGASAPSFASQQIFITGVGPISVTTADINGDGRPDLIVANINDNTVSVLLNTTAPGASVASFAIQQPFATGIQPISVTAADINGDGLPDLIVANQSDNTVSVLLNTTAAGAATPSFASQQTFAVGSGPVLVTTADINGDGKPDLVVANLNDNTVSVLLNTTAPGASTPSFATQQRFAAGNSPQSVATADINGDGKPDLVVANLNDNTVSVLLNTTAPGATVPTFATQQTFATRGGPSSVTAAEVNGDGKPDLIVANIGDHTVSVLLNTTAAGAARPSFATQRTFATGSGPVAVTVADLNGDGMPDLIVANENDNTVSVLLNTGPTPATTFDGNSFAPQQTFATESEADPRAVTAADVNGDGIPDLIVANEGGDTVSVLLNTSAPGAATASFAIQQEFAVGGFPESVFAADLNGDGKPDLIVPNAADDTVSVLLNTTTAGATTASFAAQQTFATGSSPVWATAADINGDGKPDLIVLNGFGSKTVSVLLNTSAPGATTPSFATQQTFAVGNGDFGTVTAADINGDGKPDLIATNGQDRTVSVLLDTTAPGATTPSFATQQTFATGNGDSSATSADVNGDGKPDLIVTNENDNTVSVLLNTTAPGATTLSFAAQKTFAAGGAPTSVTTADVNGDGKPDIIVSTISVLLNTTAPGATTPSFASQQTFAAGSAPISVTTADLNGDGKPDIIGTNYADFTVSVLLNSLYATAASGSPATGTIHYSVPTPTPTATATATATPTASATATPTATATASTTISVNPSTLTFGSVAVGETVVKDLTITNSGKANSLVITSAVSPDPAEFAASGGGTCGAIPVTVAPMSSCTMEIAFTPDAIGSLFGFLMIHDNSASSPQHVVVEGTGIADLSTSTSGVVFGEVKFGGSSEKSVSVTNHQTRAVSLNESVAGTNAGDFSISGGTCATTLAAKLACTLIVKFKPRVPGTELATLSISDSPDPLSPHTVALSGATIPATVKPTSTLVFGRLTSKSKTKSIRVTNLSGFSLSVSEGSISGANAGDFAVTGGTCGGGMVSAHSSCKIAVKFKPTARRSAESASLAVTIGSDPTSPHNIALTGSGP